MLYAATQSVSGGNWREEILPSNAEMRLVGVSYESYLTTDM
jgi:hypothetical protein